MCDSCELIGLARKWPSSQRAFMTKVSRGLAFFYFPVASLLRLILEIKDFLSLFT